MEDLPNAPHPFIRLNEWCRKRGISRAHAYRLRDAGLLELAYLGSLPIITADAEKRLLERAGTVPTKLVGDR